MGAAHTQLQETLAALEETLLEIQRQGSGFLDPTLVHEVEHVREVVQSPELEVKHKLKITAPIIPLILSYEGQIELGSGLDLEAAWKRLIAKVRRG